MIQQQDINDLRNTLANAYSSLDSYLKSEDEKTAEQVQLMTAKLLTIVMEKSFYIKEVDYDNVE